MSLAARLLLAMALVAVASAAAVAVASRVALARAEEERFDSGVERAVAEVGRELEAEASALGIRLAPLCAHDPALDAALVALGRGGIPAGQRLSLALRVADLGRALRFDELTLLTDRGEILGAGHAPGRAGAHDPAFAARLASAGAPAHLRLDAAPALEAACRQGPPGAALGLVAAVRLDPLLDRVARGSELALTLVAPEDAGGRQVRTLRVPALGGLSLHASRSRAPLEAAVSRLDLTLLGAASLGLLLAVALSLALARSLGRPLAELGREVRAVVSGAPRPVVARGGREVEELAGAFNRTIADLVRLRDRLAATERIAARREVAREVAHEIKNPLAPIRAAVETLRRLRERGDPAFDGYFDDATRTVLSEVRRISDIVRDFTALERLPSPRLADVDLAALLGELVTLHEGMGPTVTLELSPLPTVRADRDQLVQVFTNLVQNGIEAMSGGVGGTLRVEAAPLGDDQVRVTVTDDGPGVPAELRSRVFEPRVTTKTDGSGLGLAIAARLVLEHGGELTLAETAGRGASFVVTLPVDGPPVLPPGAPGRDR